MAGRLADELERIFPIEGELSNVASDKDSHPEKQSAPIFSTLFGIRIDLILQLEKAELSISFDLEFDSKTTS
jgi:hypothetical protein